MPSPPGTIILLVLFVVMVYPKVWLLLFLAFILSKTFQVNIMSSSAADEYTEAEKKKAFSDCFNFVSRKQKEAEAAKKKFDDAYRNWKPKRQESIRKTAEIAERIKQVNDDATPFQTIAKMASMGGKIAVFGGPVAAMTGAALSVAADIGYGACSTHKVVQMESMYKEVQRILEEDSDETEKLFRIMNEIRTISEAVKECVRTFHSATVKGFLDSVSVFQPFATAVKHIDNINDSVGVEKFLMALWEGAKNVCSDPSFRNAFSTLTAYNPGVKELLITIPEIIVGCFVLGTAIKGVPISGFLKGLTIIGIISDFEDIVSKLSQINQYPKLSKDLFEIKRKLEHEREKISKLATEINERSGM